MTPHGIHISRGKKGMAFAHTLKSVSTFILLEMDIRDAKGLAILAIMSMEAFKNIRRKNHNLPMYAPTQRRNSGFHSKKGIYNIDGKDLVRGFCEFHHNGKCKFGKECKDFHCDCHTVTGYPDADYYNEKPKTTVRKYVQKKDPYEKEIYPETTRKMVYTEKPQNSYQNPPQNSSEKIAPEIFSKITSLITQNPSLTQTSPPQTSMLPSHASFNFYSYQNDTITLELH